MLPRRVHTAQRAAAPRRPGPAARPHSSSSAASSHGRCSSGSDSSHGSSSSGSSSGSSSSSSSSSSGSSSSGSSASPSPSPPALRLSADGWRIEPVAAASPVLLVVDGTSVGAIAAGGGRRQRSPLRAAPGDRFEAWLRFLAAACGASCVLVAFDNKGSAHSSVRAQLNSSYLAGRLRKQAKQQQRPSQQQAPQQSPPTAAPAPAPAAAQPAPGGASFGWAHLAGVVQRLQQERAGAACWLVAHAAWGHEADDVLAAAAAWCRDAVQPRPLVVVATADSDASQLLDSHTHWLQLLEASLQHASGLALHSAASFTAQHGYEPAAHAHYQALTGKRNASLPGTGVPPRLAKTLLARFGTVESIAAAGEADLKPFGPAARLLLASPTGASPAAARALSNLAALRMRPEAQALPEQQLRQWHAAAAQARREPQHEPPQRSADVALLHPARQQHVAQCQPYLQLLSDALRALGATQQAANWMLPAGAWCDLVVQLPPPGRVPAGPGAAASAGAAAAGGPGDGAASPWAPAGAARCLVIQLLAPGDLCAGPELPGGWAPSYQAAVAQLAGELSVACGPCAPGHAGRSLLGRAAGGAKLQLSLLKRALPAVWRLAVVPFHVLHADGDGDGDGDGGGGGGAAAARAQAYAAALLQQAGGE